VSIAGPRVPFMRWQTTLECRHSGISRNPVWGQLSGLREPGDNRYSGKPAAVFLPFSSFRPCPVLGAIALDRFFIKIEYASLTSAIAAVIITRPDWRDWGRIIVE
jgi:hypothetical protein